MRIYVASSWRNPWQPGVVELLRSLGHEVYDFRNPPGGTSFGWREIDPHWQAWDPKVYREMLGHPRAVEGFKADFGAMRRPDACVFVQPAGSSASIELGWACGAGRRTAVLFPIDMEPRLELVGHSWSRCRGCHGDESTAPCGLPSRLHIVEPELMAKCADAILIGAEELVAWAGGAS